MTELFRTRTALLAAVALFFGLIVPGASAQTPDCGPIVRTSQVTRGMIGEGLTVVQGTTPETFGVEVLGVLKNGIGVGRDMIIVDVDAPFIDEVGGIWQGMSGSPVYVDGRLLGSVSFGLAFTSSSIGGLTPAENLVDLVSLGEGASFAADQPAAQQATVTGPLAAEIQRRVGGDSAAFTQQGVQLRQLPLPLSVSGLASSRLDSLEDVMAEHGQSMTAYAGSSAEYRQVQTTGSAPEPGENLAVAQSLGDLTMAAVGTATLECDGQVIGFGHPFTFAGPTIAGGALADAITIVPDHVGAPFKLANIGRLFGTVDEDRLEGVRADVGNFPRRIPVTSTVQDLDLGTSREGRTDVITPDALPFAAAFHLLGNIDSVIDRIGPGSSTIGFTVSGSGADSGPFTYQRGNVYASPFDIGFDSIFELLFNVDALSNFPGEEVTIDSVDIDLTLQEALSTYRIDEVRAGVDGNAPEPVGELLVQPGSVIDLEIDLTGTPDQVPLTVGLSVPVPEDAFGFGFLGISGGGGGFFFDECLFNPQACGDGNVQDLVDTLEAQPRNDELTATLQVEQIGQPGEPGQPGATEEAIAQEEGPAYAQAGDPVTSTAQLDRFVDGFVGIGVNIDSPFCPGCPPVFGRVAGEDRVGTAISTAFYAFGFAETVVLAPADDYPYALVAGPLAARDRAPILLSREGELSPGVGAAISGLGATRAVIVAPDGQLTGTVEDDLRAAGITTIERLGGADRYAVADSVAAAMGGTRAWVVEGENADPNRGWPDAVSAGPVAGLEGAPILLTRAGDLPQTTADTLARLGITDVSIAGGEAAVSQAVADDIASRGISVERIAGDNRYDTSYLLAQRAIDLGGVPFNTWMVTGLDFPDALSTAPAVVATGGVMIMGDGQDVYASPAAVQYFTDLQYTAPFVTFVGGFAAISQTVEEQVFGILIGQPAGGEGEPGSPTPQPTSQPPPPPPPGVPPPPPPQP